MFSFRKSIQLDEHTSANQLIISIHAMIVFTPHVVARLPLSPCSVCEGAFSMLLRVQSKGRNVDCGEGTEAPLCLSVLYTESTHTKERLVQLKGMR